MRILTFKQIKNQIDAKKDHLRKLQNSYIEKNKKLVSQTRKVNLTSIHVNNNGGTTPYQTLKPKEKL